MDENEYYQAVIDSCKLLAVSLKELNDSNDKPVKDIVEIIYRQIEKIEIELEKYVPRLSPLYTALNIKNESTESKSSYWEGVRDTTNLIRNYLSINKNDFSLTLYKDFVYDIIVRSSQKINSTTSPLVEKLGITFEDPISTKEDLKLERNDKNIPLDVESSLEEARTQFESQEKAQIQEESDIQGEETTLFSDEFNNEAKIKEIKQTEPVENLQTDTTYNLSQSNENITEISNNDNYSTHTEINEQLDQDEIDDDIIDLEMEELEPENRIANLRSGLLSQINEEIKKLDEEDQKKIIEERQQRKKIPILNISQNNEERTDLDDKENFSSSLKDALRMLRTDDKSENFEEN